MPQTRDTEYGPQEIRAIREEEVRSLLEGLPGDRTITDAHVERVARHTRAVVAQAHDNPR